MVQEKPEMLISAFPLWTAAMQASPMPTAITVPFCYQCEASGIHDTGKHEVVWYRRALTVPENMKGRRLLLRRRCRGRGFLSVAECGCRDGNCEKRLSHFCSVLSSRLNMGEL